VEQARPAIRIVVAQPAEPALGAALGTVEALRRLGGEAEISLVRGASACAECCAEAEVDLLVVDRDLGADFERILEQRRSDGPPVVVVSRDASDAAALDAFRRGASDCVSAGGEYADVLPVVALEQIRRWRTIRERGAAERRIRDLERTSENIIQNMNSALLVVDTKAKSPPVIRPPSRSWAAGRRICAACPRGIGSRTTGDRRGRWPGP